MSTFDEDKVLIFDVIKGEERKEEGGKRWDAKTCRGDLCNSILNRHEQSKTLG